MLVFVFGLPGEFARWCSDIALGLLQHADGPADLIHADSLRQIGRGAIGAGSGQAVVFSPQPGGRLGAALIASGRPFVVALDDPRATLVDVVAGQGVDLAAAVRALANSCAALPTLVAAAGALTLWRDRDWRIPGATTIAIARHLQLPLDDDAVSQLLCAAAPDAAMRPRPDAAAWWSARTEAEQQLVIGALTPYVDERLDGSPLSFTWTAPLFFRADAPEEHLTGPVDVTGRARCLLQGPNILLPAGEWSLTLVVSLSGAAAEHEYTVEIVAGSALASGVLASEGASHAELTLAFTLETSAEHPVTIRTSTRRAAFDGTIEIEAVRLVRTSPTGPEAAPLRLSPRDAEPAAAAAYRSL